MIPDDATRIELAGALGAVGMRLATPCAMRNDGDLVALEMAFLALARVVAPHPAFTEVCRRIRQRYPADQTAHLP